MRKIGRYFKGVAEEAHRVRWPGSKELWKAVAIVVVILVICCLVLLLSDYIAYEMRSAFEGQIPSTATSSGTSVDAEEVSQAFRLVKSLFVD